MDAPQHPTWTRAMIALHLVAVDPSGLGGILLRARAGPARDAFLRAVMQYKKTTRKLHPAMTDDALFGGLDLNATLAGGTVVRQVGLADHDGPLILPMAERTPPQLAARLASIIDGKRTNPLIALDEGTDEEAVPPALSDRLAFHVDLDGLTMADVAPLADALPSPRALPRANEIQIEQIAMVAEALGVQSPRAALFALRAATAHAALQGRDSVIADDIETAVAMVLAPRATRLPPQDTEDQQTSEPAPPEKNETTAPPDEMPDTIPDDMLIDAIRALLPDDILTRIAAGKARQATGAGSGDTRTGNRRGRPVPSRRGRLDGSARIDLIATLRSAAPWQKARRRLQPDRTGVLVRPADIFIRRYEQKSDRLLIFAVDASGSAAMTRLAEAKGAVELMLAAAYARRDHVALIGFRGSEADVLLSPTRSLVRTKRELAALPGGSATPLAHGLRAALDMARPARRRGMTPTLILLTDGRANIALDGTAHRVRAGEDASEIARAIAAERLDALVIDMGTRPEPTLKTLAATMHGHYAALPRADSHRISATVTNMLNG